jgi:DNA-binding LacI/PurR family transcriptional regulator
MTLGALLAIQKIELQIPGRRLSAGFDDPEWTPMANPPLTAVARPTYEMGVRAVRALLDRIEGNMDGNAGKVLLEPWMVVRRSTAPPIGEASMQP